MWLHCCAVVITVTCRALLCRTCTLQLGFSIPKPSQPPTFCLFGGFLFIKWDIQRGFLCAVFFFPNVELPPSNLYWPASQIKWFFFFFFKPWASDGFEICLKVIKQEAEFYSTGEGRDSQNLILRMGQYLLSTTQWDMLFKTLDRDVFNQINSIKNSFHIYKGSWMPLLLEPEAGRLRGWEC